MKNIAVLYGGNSGEFEVSVGSGKVVASCLEKAGFKPFLICVKGKDWFFETGNKEKRQIDKNNFTLTLAGEIIEFSCAFNAIHGDPGENGRIEAYLEMMEIPCTSSGMTTSALTFHKNFCNRVVGSYGFKVAYSEIVKRNTDVDLLGVGSRVGFPCFVKPCSSGSSVGVSKVNSQMELQGAIAKVFEIDDEAMVETYIKGREFGCGLMEVNGEIKALPLTEIISTNDFFDYEAKYSQGKAQEITPPENLSESATQQMKDIALSLFKILNCHGFVRFDFILPTDEQAVFLEVNTVPGLSEASIIPQQIQYLGMKLEDFFKQVVLEALNRK